MSYIDDVKGKLTFTIEEGVYREPEKRAYPNTNRISLMHMRSDEEMRVYLIPCVLESSNGYTCVRKALSKEDIVKSGYEPSEIAEMCIKNQARMFPTIIEDTKLYMYKQDRRSGMSEEAARLEVESIDSENFTNRYILTNEGDQWDGSFAMFDTEFLLNYCKNKLHDNVFLQPISLHSCLMEPINKLSVEYMMSCYGDLMLTDSNDIHPGEFPFCFPMTYDAVTGKLEVFDDHYAEEIQEHGRELTKNKEKSFFSTIPLFGRR